MAGARHPLMRRRAGGPHLHVVCPGAGSRHQHLLRAALRTRAAPRHRHCRAGCDPAVDRPCSATGASGGAGRAGFCACECPGHARRNPLAPCQHGGGDGVGPRCGRRNHVARAAGDGACTGSNRRPRRGPAAPHVAAFRPEKTRRSGRWRAGLLHGAAGAAAVTGGAGRLRLWPQLVARGRRRNRAGDVGHRDALRRSEPPRAARYFASRYAVCHGSTNPRRAGRALCLLRRGADHGRAQFHSGANQQQPADFRALPHPVDLRPAHVASGGRRVLGTAGGTRTHTRPRAPLPDPQMGCCGSVADGVVLHVARQWRRGNGALFHHGGHRVLCHHRRPPRSVDAQPRTGGHSSAAARPASCDRSKLPDVLSGRPGARCLL